MNNRHIVPVKPDGQLAVLALEASLDGLWDWDLKSDRIYFSSQLKALLGYGVSELSDDPLEWFSRIHTDDHHLVRKSLSRHIEGETAYFRSEHRLQHSDGSYRWILARGIALRDDADHPYRVVGTFTDVNERKQHELQLSQQLDELRFALASEKVLMDELDRKNRELMELSITDGLTGLYNHRHLHERFDYEFKRVRRYGGMLSCILIDIDHFKSLNDAYGHQYGDYVIRQIASIIKTHSREVDICGRYGGEEFMVISNVNKKNALLYAAKLHAEVQKYSFEHPSTKVKVTVSIGVAEYNSEIRTKQELIERADRAMYQAKNDGRNLIRLWKDSDAVDMMPINRDEVAELIEKFMKLSAQMQSSWMNSASSLVLACEDKDPRTRGHASNVAHYAVIIAKNMKLTQDQIETVRFGALLHDIGKISIPDYILHKRQTLTAKEKKIVQRHSEVGAHIIEEIKFLDKELPLILHHHERYDGNGYPHGLHGREIPLGARIVAVADAFDVMVYGRVSGRKITVESACTRLIKGKKKIYCPECVDALIKHVNRQISSKKKSIVNSARRWT